MQVFLCIALLCVPIMLFVKPILEYRMFKQEVLEIPKVSIQDENQIMRLYTAINEDEVDRVGSQMKKSEVNES